MTASLIRKELRLSMHPMTAVFALFGVMLLIPSYPYAVAFFYVCLGVFFTFQNARENADNAYTAVLPVSKRDIVKARLLFAVLVQLASVLISLPFAFLNHRLFDGNPAGMDVNAAFYGFVLVLFAVFNLIFFTMHYKTAYNIGIPFLAASGGITAVTALTVILPFLPGVGAYFDGTSAGAMVRQLPVLGAGALIYVGSFFLTLRNAAKRFENAPQ